MVGKEGMREEEIKIGRTSALEKTTKQFNIQPIPIGVTELQLLTLFPQNGVIKFNVFI